MTFINRAEVSGSPAAIQNTLVVPSAGWPVMGGLRFDPTTNEMAVTTDSAPQVGDAILGGLRFNAAGQLYVWPFDSLGPPTQILYVGGLARTSLCQLVVTEAAPVNYVGGWPIAANSFVCFETLGLPAPIFRAPLVTSLTASVAGGSAAATFTRASVGKVACVPPTGIAGQPLVLTECAINEARFYGARRISQDVWSATYADGQPINYSQLAGVVIEASATNTIAHSQRLATEDWGVTGATLTENVATAPNGLLEGSIIQSDAAGPHVIDRPVYTPGTGLVYTFSVYLKRASGSGVVRIGLDSSTTIVVPITTEWQRFSITGTQTTYKYRIELVNDNEAVYAWGAQSEQGAFPTSLIKTLTIQVTRSPDVLSYASAGNVNAAANTLYAEFSTIRSPSVYAASPLQTVMSISGATFTAANGMRLTLQSPTTMGFGATNITTPTIPWITLGNNVAGRFNTVGTLQGAKGNSGAIANAANCQWTGVGTTAINIGSSSPTVGGDAQGAVAVRNAQIFGVYLTDYQMGILTAVPPTVPAAPTMGTATGLDSSARVTFTANSDGGSAVAYFTATATPGGASAQGASSPIVVPGLVNGSQYTIQVTATNGVGTSSPSSASNIVTPNPVAAAVERLVSGLQVDASVSETYDVTLSGEQVTI